MIPMDEFKNDIDDKMECLESALSYLMNVAVNVSAVDIEVDENNNAEIKIKVFPADEDEDEDEGFAEGADCDEDCDNCPYYDEEDDDVAPCLGLPAIDKIIFNPPATIVYWCDGTKTVVKCMEGQAFEKYAGFAAACMKKLFGSTSRAKDIMEYCNVENKAECKNSARESKPEKKPEPKEEPRPERQHNETASDPLLDALIHAFFAGIKMAMEEKIKDEDAAE